MGRVPTVSRGRQKILSGRHGGVFRFAGRARPDRLLIPTHRIPRTLVLLAAFATATVACDGSESGSALASRPDSLTFETTPVGRVSLPRVVEWANAGSDMVSIVELRLEGEGLADFVIDEDLCAGASLGPGRSCTAVVLFGPRQTGAREAWLAPVTAAGAGPPVALRGAGIVDSIAPLGPVGLVRAVPETLDFGEQPVGTPGGPLSVRLVNQRPGPVQFAVRLQSEEAGEYRVALDRCSNEILAPGRACTIRILFEPTAEGLRAGELILRDLNGTTTQSVPLSGTGIAAPGAAAVGSPVVPASLPLSVGPRAIEFGVQATGSASGPRVVRIENNGPANVVLTSLRVAGDGAPAFRIVGGDCERRTLVPTRACAIEIVFQPGSEGSHAARVEAVTSAGVEPALVLLAGTGETR